MPDNKLKAECVKNTTQKTNREGSEWARTARPAGCLYHRLRLKHPEALSKGQVDVTGEWAAVGLACVREAASAFGTRICGGGRCGGEGDGLMAICPLSCPWGREDRGASQAELDSCHWWRGGDGGARRGEGGWSGAGAGQLGAPWESNPRVCLFCSEN